MNIILSFDSHYPQTKATVVAETPELARLTQASKNQSQVRIYLMNDTGSQINSYNVSDN